MAKKEKIPTEYIHILFPAELKKRLRLEAVINDTTLTDMLVAFAERYFEEKEES